jgi:FkbM family methyltransferase
MGVSAAARPGVTTARTAAGRPIHVDPTDPRGDHLVASHGDFNPFSRILWHRALRLHEWDVVVDVGVNYGEMLVDAPIPPGARLVGFEPNVALHPYLERTCAENGIVLDLRLEAVSDRAGTAAFAVDGDWSGRSTLVPPGDADPARWRTSEVALTTLDAVLDDASSWCVKVDVEGAETAVLRGAAESMRSESWALMFEVLHLSADDLARVAVEHATYLLDRRTHALVPLPGGNVKLARDMLASGWLYPQDCLVLGPAIAALAVA